MFTSALLSLLLACGPTRVVVTDGEVEQEPTPEVDPTPETGDEPEEEVEEEEEDAEIEQVGGTGVVGDDEEEDEELLYLDDVVGELRLELTDEEARALLRNPTEWTSATLVRDEERLAVAVRLKGSSTYMPFGSKPSWKVDVDRYVEDQTYLGHGEFNLHNQILDPSVMSEALTFGAYRALGVPAPRVGYVRLTVNDEDYGLYTVVEPTKREFLRSWFDEDEGDLYENGYQDCDITRPSCFDVEQDDMADTDGLDELKAISRLEGDEWREAMMAIFDWDMFLDAMAMEAMVAHWDSYSYDVSNYRLFHSASTGQMYFLPWSADLGFGYRPWSYPDCGMYGVAPGDYDDGRLAYQCERDETCHQELVDRMEELLLAWETTDPVAELDRLTELLRPELETDPKAMYDVDDFDQHVQCVREWIGQRPDEVRAWIAEERGE